MSAVLDLADAAAEQWGLVTTAQARALGVTAQGMARLTDQGALERITHGVYRVSGVPPEPLDELRAAWLTLEPGRRAADRLRDPATAVVSHRSAADLHGLGDLDADEHEFTTEERKQSRRPGIRLHRGRMTQGEWTVVGGLPVTTVVRTVADLAEARVDGGHLASIVRDALTVKQVSDLELTAALRTCAHRYGVALGDGEALLARFVQESGVPQPLGRAVELAGVSNTAAAFAQALTASPEMQRLSEQMISIYKTTAPTISPGVEQALSQIIATFAEHALTPVRDVVVPVDLTEISRLTEQLRQAVSTPQVQRLMAEQAEKR